MLSIKRKDGSWQYEWHVGDPLPIVDMRVVTIQVDGHELEMIMEAMRATREISAGESPYADRLW